MSQVRLKVSFSVCTEINKKIIPMPIVTYHLLFFFLCKQLLLTDVTTDGRN